MKLILFDKYEYERILNEYKKFLSSITEINDKTGSIHYINLPELNGKRVETHSVFKLLSSIGMTKQDWVNIHMFGDKDVVPLCPYCKKSPCKLKIWEYRKSCCSKECRDKLCKEINSSDEFRSRISESVKNLWKDDSYRELQSESHKEFWKIDENASRALENHYYPSRRGCRSSIYSEYENKTIYFDSNWERKFYLKLKDNDDIESIIRNVEFIKYIDSSDNSYKRYKPDFKIIYKDGRIELIEIKPLRLINETIVQDKKKFSEEFCKNNGMSYKILTEIELRDMGIDVR